MTVQAGLCRTWSEPKLLVFSRTGSNDVSVAMDTYHVSGLALELHFFLIQNVDLILEKKGVSGGFVLDDIFCLFVLRHNVPVNNFSVMSGRSQRFLGLSSTVGS